MRCCAGFTSTLCFLTLALAACSGSQKGAEAPTLTAADPEAIGKMAQAVEAARSRQEVPKAIGLFKQALKADSTLWEARYDLGVLLAQSGELAAAEKHLTQAAELAPNAEDVLVALSEVRRRQGDAEGAVEALEHFVEAHPDAIVARVALMSGLREGGRTDEAIEHAQEVLVRRAGDPNALSELALAYLDKGEIDTAVLLSQESLKLKESAVAERTAGLLALEQGDDAIAFRHFSRASELDPSDTTARLNMGTVLLQAGVYPQAEQHFRAVLKTKPLDVEAGVGLAASLRGQGSRDEPEPYRQSEKLLLELLERHSGSFTVAYNLGILYADYLQRPADAERMFKRYLDSAPRAHAKRDQAKKRLGDLKTAAK